MRVRYLMHKRAERIRARRARSGLIRDALALVAVLVLYYAAFLAWFYVIPA